MSAYFIPDAATLLKYSLACFVLFVTPGPDMSLFLSKTLSGGRQAGIASMLGACAGVLVHTMLAALGLSLLIATSPAAFTVMKVLGALYLIWLAIGAIRQGSALNVRAQAKTSFSFWRTFLMGLGVNLTNPKVVLFFITFLPLFVAGDDPHASSKLLFLGVYFVHVHNSARNPDDPRRGAAHRDLEGPPQDHAGDRLCLCRHIRALRRQHPQRTGEELKSTSFAITVVRNQAGVKFIATPLMQ